MGDHIFENGGWGVGLGWMYLHVCVCVAHFLFIYLFIVSFPNNICFSNLPSWAFQFEEDSARASLNIHWCFEMQHNNGAGDPFMRCRFKIHHQQAVLSFLVSTCPKLI